MPFEPGEKLTEIGYVLFRGREAGGALEKHAASAEGFSRRAGRQPGFVDDGRWLEGATIIAFGSVQLGSHTPVGRARGGVRDELPGFDGELKIGRSLGAPAL